MTDLLTFGETMCLFTPEADRPFALTGPFHVRFGGSESNMAITAARLGVSVCWHSRVGSDPLGQLMVEEVARQGVGTSSVQVDPKRNTGLMLKRRRPDGEADVYYYRRSSAASAITVSNFPYELIAKARWLHVSGITPALSRSAEQAWLEALRVARAHQIPVSLDPNIRLKLWGARRARQFLLTAIGEGVDLLVPNLDEGTILFGDHPPEELARRAVAAGARRVALKLGAQGAILAEADGTLERIPPYTALPVVDPVGAGDSFAGGLVAGLLKGLSFHDAGRLAVYCGACAVSAVGDWEGAPTWAQAAAALEGSGEGCAT